MAPLMKAKHMLRRHRWTERCLYRKASWPSSCIVSRSYSDMVARSGATDADARRTALGVRGATHRAAPGGHLRATGACMRAIVSVARPGMQPRLNPEMPDSVIIGTKNFFCPFLEGGSSSCGAARFRPEVALPCERRREGGSAMSNPDPSYNLRFKVRMGDVSGVKSILKQNGADLCAKGETLRGWTAVT